MLGLHSILYDKPSFAFNYGSNSGTATATRASTDSNNVKFVARFIFVVRFLCMDVVAKMFEGT